MQISWSGYGSFRLQENATTVLFDPFDPASDFKIRKTPADLVLLSHRQTKDDLACVSGDSFMIDSPGEYEVKNIFVNALSYNGQGVIYWLSMGDITFGWLGPITHNDLSAEILGIIEGVDILFIPVGGGSFLSTKEAVGMINKIEPRLVIPAYFKISGSKGLGDVEAFLKEYSAPVETIDKLKISKKDLQTEDTRVVVLKP